MTGLRNTGNPGLSTHSESAATSTRYRSIYRTDAARLDAMIEDYTLREHGVIEDDQPTAYSHDRYMLAWDKRAFGDFSPEERAEIRAHLGIGPFGADRG